MKTDRPGHRWALAALWEAARDGFLADWRRLTDAERSGFLRRLALGLAAVLLLTAAVALVAEARLGGREAALEADLVLAVADGPWPSFPMAIWLEGPGGSVYLLPLLVVLTWTAARLGRSLEALAVAASFLGAKPILLVGRTLFPRERPDLVAGGVAVPGSNSFPSGHTLQAFCVWGVLLYLLTRASRSPLERTVAVVLWLAVGSVVALARVRLGTHWPSDVAAGALLGVAWAGALAVALRARARPGGDAAA